MEQSIENKKPISGWHVLAGFICFFLTVFTANGIMTYFALGTWQGVQTEDAYVKGLNYNRQLEQAQNQQDSQWKITFDRLPRMQNGDRVSVAIEHPEGNVALSSVAAEFIRPVERGYDFTVELAHQGDQVYAAPVTFPLKGNWKARVTVKVAGGDEIFLTDRMEIK